MSCSDNWRAEVAVILLYIATSLPSTLHSWVSLTMDLNMSVSAISIGILFFSVFLSLLTRKSKGRLSCLPGPSALPIIGNLHQLGALPHRTLQRMAEKHGPIMSLKLGSLDFVVASSSQVTKQIMKTHDLNFSNRAPSTMSKYLLYNGRDILTAAHGEYWRDMRKVSVVELLNSKRIDSFGNVMEEEAVAMVRRARTGEWV